MMQHQDSQACRAFHKEQNDAGPKGNKFPDFSIKMPPPASRPT
jgi:hypothetical protein